MHSHGRVAIDFIFDSLDCDWRGQKKFFYFSKLISRTDPLRLVLACGMYRTSLLRLKAEISVVPHQQI
jgi:hypothetical protein